MQKMGWFGVARRHSKSTAMSPFDRAHTTSYSTLIETMCLSCTGDLWHQKTRVPGLSCGVVCVILRLAVLVELRLVTDRRTRTQTDTDTGPWLVPGMHSIAR